MTEAPQERDDKVFAFCRVGPSSPGYAPGGRSVKVASSRMPSFSRYQIHRLKPRTRRMCTRIDTPRASAGSVSIVASPGSGNVSELHNATTVAAIARDSGDCRTMPSALRRARNLGLSRGVRATRRSLPNVAARRPSARRRHHDRARPIRRERPRRALPTDERVADWGGYEEPRAKNSTIDARGLPFARALVHEELASSPLPLDPGNHDATTPRALGEVARLPARLRPCEAQRSRSSNPGRPSRGRRRARVLVGRARTGCVEPYSNREPRASREETPRTVHPLSYALRS